MLYIRYPLSLRQVEDMLFERGIDICHVTVRFWWNRFGPMFAAEIRKKRVYHRLNSNWRWHLDRCSSHNRETHYFWRAVDDEGEVLEVFSKRQDRKAALLFLKKAMKRYGRPTVIVTNVGPTERRWLNNRAVRISRSDDGKGRCPGSAKSRRCSLSTAKTASLASVHL